MGVSFETFQRLANSTHFSSRDIVVNAQNKTAKLGHFFISSGKDINVATMKAFREAISHKYGVFGQHAFDTVLGKRLALRKSLRACDVKATFSQLEPLKKQRFINELNRQLDTSPKVQELSPEMRKALQSILTDAPFTNCNIKNCTSSSDISSTASGRIDEAIEFVRLRNQLHSTKKINTKTQLLGQAEVLDKPVASNDPTGLKQLNTIFEEGQTSVEDQVKTGKLGVGMRINRSSTNAVLLDSLKSNGVEPGFIYRNDWSLNDSKSLMMDINSEESLAALNKLLQDHPETAAKCEGLSRREQIMLFGRAHPAGMSAVSEYILEKGMGNPDSTIYKAFCQKFPHADPALWSANIKNLKKALFSEIRDAVMNVRKNDPDYGKSPIFKHFTDRHIVKLDYNENDRIFESSTASAGKFMRPERIKVGRTNGQLYRLQTATTADDASAGAVTEALANDLTRLAGIPSQELSIVRGKYSDGHPKLMLEAKFADGYQDMENGYIRDGQIVSPEGKQVESLGKYKAFFLVTADRDAVGSRGQNKGFTHTSNAPGTFFAIDPGHSLEGNSRYLEVSDNFSFKDTYGFSLKPRFRNFSVFDDDTRFAKFQGALKLRDLERSGKVEALFSDYRTKFDPDAAGISPDEQKLRVKIKASIDKKEAEFKDSMAKILSLASNQFALYDDLAADGAAVQEKAIETIENLEKLTSPTTWVSPKGQVPLKHLSVIPETRVPWRAYVEGDSIVYHCDQPLSEENRLRLSMFASGAKAQLTIDADGCAKLTVARATADTSLNVFSEDKVANFTHPDEAAARMRGETGLAEARTTQATAKKTASPAPKFELPERLELTVGGDTLSFRKDQFESMLANTPAAERPKSLQQLKDILAARIQRGRDILRAIYEGKGHRYEASTRNVACLTMALHAGTVKKGELNLRGAFSVDDPDGKIYHWLDSCKELYLRTSTHAKAYHHQIVDGHKNMPRGLDIPQGMGGLMGGMRTLHYFALPPLGKQPRRLYLKCETHGIYNSTISKAEVEESRSLGMQTRGSRWGDRLESLKHGLSLLSVFTRRGNTEGNRKENIPNEILRTLNGVQATLRKAGFREVADLLGNDVKTGGMRKLVDNIAEALTRLPNEQIMRTVTGTLLDIMFNQTEEYSGDGANRIGREVMLEAADVI